ncbi:MAG: ABC-F family ATP-binding cassette domain-containing protein [Lutibacter sp.]
MNLISVENISKSYGELTLFSSVSFGINEGQKIAFIAKNGTGKTSLLNILTGKDLPDTGKVVLRKNLKLAYLSQQDLLDENLTVEESIFNSDQPLLKIIRNYELALLNPDNQEEYEAAFDQMERNNAWDFETLYKQILFKLNLQQLNKKVKNLSGGQRKRLSLAIALMQKPELLILDEPTNHLDLEMIEWLENFLNKEKITLFMVTHDRYFLERVCNEIIELDNKQLFTYKGNYSYFLQKKEERIANEQAEILKAKNLYKTELEWIKRQPKARTSKSKFRIDSFGDLKQKAHKKRENHKIQLALNMTRMGSKIIEIHNLSKQYNNINLIEQFNYVFKKGERVGIIGKNGSGKSTFLNLITQTLKPDSGKVVIGETIKFGYYTQKGITIKPNQKVIEVIKEFGEYIPLQRGQKISASQLLERFLFNRKKQYDFVEKLSGGEQKRLYLCTVLMQNPNFLIFDEPTNDLDIITLNVLENYLLDFPGCLIVVSHDRYFMDKIVDHLFVFEGNGLISDFPGNYSDYRSYENNKNPTSSKEDSEKPKSKKSLTKKVKLTYKEKIELRNLEDEIDKIEQEKLNIEQQFANNSIPINEIDQWAITLKNLKTDLENKENRWFEISSKITD